MKVVRLAKLRDAGIVQVHEVGRFENTAYIVSDFIAGHDLRAELRGSRVDSRCAAEICREIAEALSFAHQQGIVHRDLKPANILIDTAGKCFLTDFGLAKQMASHHTITTGINVLGTPAYMSPEQAAGESRKVDHRTDIYSLGVILYEMLTGSRPFEGKLEEVIGAILTRNPTAPRKRNPKISKRLESICQRAMAKQPADRYQTASELADDLQRYLSGVPLKTGRLAALRPRLRTALRPAIFTAIFAVGIILAFVSSAFRSPSTNSTPAASQVRHVRITTSPAGAHIVFVPLSKSGVPEVREAVLASKVTPVDFDLAANDYAVEAVLPNGNFQEVFRHVPKVDERGLHVENHLSWSIAKDGAVILPAITIPDDTITAKMIFVPADPESASQGPQSSEPVAFYVDRNQFTVADCLGTGASLSSYIYCKDKLGPEMPMPLTCDNAIAYAEFIGRRLPSAEEWRRQQQVLVPRSPSDLAEWTTNWTAINPATVGGTLMQHDEGRVVCGGSNQLIRGEPSLSTADCDATNTAVLTRLQYFPGVGVRCVRSAAPRYYYSVQLSAKVN